MENNSSDTEKKTLIQNDIRMSITLDYKEDNTLHTYAAVHIAPPFDNLLSPSEQEADVRVVLINSDIKRLGNIDEEIINDIHNLARKLLNRTSIADANN